MATFVLIPGAGGVAWYWHRVAPLLRHAGHEAMRSICRATTIGPAFPHMPIGVVDATGTQNGDLVVVAQSLGGFTAPLVCQRTRVRELVFVNAMIPLPGETAGEWWDHTGSEAARVAAAERGRLQPDSRPRHLFPSRRSARSRRRR